MWHGWLLDGSGSNVYTAKTAEAMREMGHDVLVVCQEPHPENLPWVDAWAGVDHGVGPLLHNGHAPAASGGRVVMLRPQIGPLLPVFVVDEYEGFEVKRFVDLTHAELTGYLESSVSALRAAAEWHASEVAIAGHAIPGGVIARRALGPGRYITKIHGSDLEYAIRLDARYRELAAEGLSGGLAVTGSSDNVLRRCVELVPGIEHLLRTVSPGVDVTVFRPRPRAAALRETAALLDTDRDSARGRPERLDAEVARALERRDGGALDTLASGYDQEVPDPDAASRLRRLASGDGPIAGYFGKLIPQKGVANLLLAANGSEHRPRTLVVGFGTHREWLQSLTLALRAGDAGALAWLATSIGLPVRRPLPRREPAPDPAVTFTGRLDHRYAPGVLAAMDVMVVPSILDEAFGIVTVEGAAAGALPLVARHSGLAEVAGALEAEVGRPGLFSFAPRPDAARNLAEGLDRLLALDLAERDALRASVVAFVGRTWSWRRTAERLLEAATIPPGRRA